MMLFGKLKMSGVLLLSNVGCDNKIPNKFSEEINLKTCSTKDIEEYLDYLLPVIEKELSVEIIRIKKFSFAYSINNNNVCYLNVFKKPLDYSYYSYGIPESKETICVFYLFNYYSFNQLGLSIKSFFNEIILKNKLKSISGEKGYYDVKFSKHFFIGKEESYKIKENEHLQYFHFKETLADRKTIIEFNECMKSVVKELGELTGIIVEKAVQSEESESFYISIQYRKKKIKRNLKISVRSHPMHTKAQMCFYGGNYDSLDSLKDKLVKTIKEFNWYNYKFTLDNYYDVLPDEIILKKCGQDMCLYSDEQIAFIEKTKETNRPKKMLNNPFDILPKLEDFI